MNKQYDLCDYYFDCKVSKKTNKDCINTDCQVKKFYDKFGINYLEKRLNLLNSPLRVKR